MMEKSGWLKHWPWLVATLLLALAALSFVGYRRLSQPVTTVLVIRHAEKSATPADNPPLTAEGQTRAQELARTVETAGINAIYSSSYARTLQTAEPLAKRLGIPVTQYDAKDTDGLIQQVLKDHRGEVVLIVGHSNTVPGIIEKLGAGQIPPIADTDHDKLFVVTIPKLGKARVVQLRYGKPS